MLKQNRRRIIALSVIYLERHLHRRVFTFIGKVVSLIYYYFNIKSKSIVKENLRSIHTKFSIKLYLNFAKILAENLYLMHHDIDKSRFVMHDTEVLENALEQGRGVMLISMHYSMWELSGQYLAKKGYPLNVIYEKKPDWIYSYLDNIRTKYGIKLIKRNSPVKSFLDVFRRNEMLVVMIDQKSYNKCLQVVPFLSLHREMPSGWYSLLKYSKAVPVIIYARMQKTGNHIYFRNAEKFEYLDYYRYFEHIIKKDIYQYDLYDRIWQDINI